MKQNLVATIVIGLLVLGIVMEIGAGLTSKTPVDLLQTVSPSFNNITVIDLRNISPLSAQAIAATNSIDPFHLSPIPNYGHYTSELYVENQTIFVYEGFGANQSLAWMNSFVPVTQSISSG